MDQSKCCYAIVTIQRYLSCSNSNQTWKYERIYFFLEKHNSFKLIVYFYFVPTIYVDVNTIAQTCSIY